MLATGGGESKVDGDGRDRPAAALGNIGLAASADTVAALLGALASGHVGVCLCDALDQVRYVNAAFRTRFFGDLPEAPVDFVDALAEAIRRGRGIKLETMTLEAFIPRVRQRRKTADQRHDFAVDLADGSWWWVNDHKLADGSILVIATEISSIKNEEVRLRDAHATALRASRTDFLTGVANRRHGFERAELALVEFRENRLPLSLALLDIDHFKGINDSYGHDVGDKVLALCAAALEAGVRPQDQVSRIGGEEFMIVMPGTTASRAQWRLRRLLASLPAVDAGEGRQPLRFTMSAGAAAAHYRETLTGLLHRADVALYAAKAKGRHRVELGPPPEEGDP